MHRRLDTLIYIVSAVFLIGAVTIWWQGVRPSKAPAGLEAVGPVPGSGTPETLPAGEPEPPEEPATLVVHVGGAVKSPGVYRLQEGQRVYEAIALAGPEEDAELDLLNLAAVLKDSQRIIVPRKGESPPPGSGSSPGQGGGSGTDFSSGTPSPTYPLNVNTASQAELESLPGIGPVLARAIIDYRERCGPFKKIEDLLSVSGIGEKILARISGYLVAE